MPGVDACRDGGRSTDGGVPFPPPMFGPRLGLLVAGGEGSFNCEGAYT
jgi:hypothetical protein